MWQISGLVPLGGQYSEILAGFAALAAVLWGTGLLLLAPWRGRGYK